MDTQACVCVWERLCESSLCSSRLILPEQQAFLSCTLTGDYNNNNSIMRHLDYHCWVPVSLHPEGYSIITIITFFFFFFTVRNAFWIRCTLTCQCIKQTKTNVEVKMTAQICETKLMSMNKSPPPVQDVFFPLVSTAECLSFTVHEVTHSECNL